MSNEYSVCQFLVDGTHEYTRRFVSMGEALQAFDHYTNNVASKMGLTDRVIITDGGDSICKEWQYGKGITYNNMPCDDERQAYNDASCRIATKAEKYQRD